MNPNIAFKSISQQYLSTANTFSRAILKISKYNSFAFNKKMQCMLDSSFKRTFSSSAMTLENKVRILNLPEEDPKSSLALVYETNGQPIDVLKVASVPLKPLGPSDILVAIVASPVNPSDINQVQGVYPSRPTIREDAGYVGGNEGSAVVLRVGSEVKSLKRGDLIIPAFKCPGTWRQYAIWPADGCIKYGENPSTPEEAERIENSPEGPHFDPKEAARLSVNPCTAYRMLHDFVDLRPGDVVIQNGGNSMVGKSVIQLAKIYGYKTINVVRARETLEETNSLKKSLTDIGADLVVTEEELAEAKGKLSFVKFNGNKAKLALNCVGSSVATKIANELEESSPFVTYGAMSAKPLPVLAQHLIFKDIKFVGYWMNRWYLTSPVSERLDMISDLRKFKNSGKFKFPDPELELLFGTNLKEAEKTLDVIISDKKGKRFLVFMS